MQLMTTFRSLNPSESATAQSSLERSVGRLDRLVDQPVPLRAVVEGGSPEYQATLTMSIEGEDLIAQCSGHDLAQAVTTACERLRNQLLRMRRRRQTKSQKNSSSAPN